MKKNISDYLKTVIGFSKELGISQWRVRIYCAEDRIERAFKCRQCWLIPRDAQKLHEKERGI